MSLTAIRASTEAGSAEQKRLLEKKRNIIILIHQHLIENGYVESAERLQKEAGIICNRFEVADNVDLNLILGEYENYYELKFDKKPKIVKKLKDGEESTKRIASETKPKASAKVEKKTESKPTDDDDSSSFQGIQGLSLNGSSAQLKKPPAKPENSDDVDLPENRLLRPLPQYSGDLEMKALCAAISRDIYQDSPNVSFDDITGLDDAKRLLAEAIQLPLKFPSLFTGILRPWRGILLHGPPGTGKTLLAKAVATECRTTFFNISASTLVSKWRGDSEKLVRALFELARYHGPSTIFLDEIDAILSARGSDGGGNGEHEASRRMKTELLIQMDGLKGYKSSESVFVMAASNLPWDLDVAVLRRLEKRVLVSLPIAEARSEMIRMHLSDRSQPDIDFDQLAERTVGYSGADIELLCREAAMRPVRRLMTRLQDLPDHPLPMPPSGAAAKNQKAGGNSAVKGVKLLKQAAEDVEQLLKSDPVTFDDIFNAIESTKPSSDGNMSKYESWQREFGSC